MTTSRKLEEIASNLDDMSVTLEEIKEEVSEGAAADRERLDKIHQKIERATDEIEEKL